LFEDIRRWSTPAIFKKVCGLLVRNSNLDFDHTHLPFQTTGVKRWPPGRCILILGKDIETRYPRRLRGA